ncbi:hypothetical protein [Nonomuraea salmonea]|uniref:hypothetical protein n=1 Tax=Nonomuraea salmonea TaxID=46181 RepID=UPI0031E8701B
MSAENLKLDLRGLEVDSIDVVSADSIVAEGHGSIETGGVVVAGLLLVVPDGDELLGSGAVAPVPVLR